MMLRTFHSFTVVRGLLRCALSVVIGIFALFQPAAAKDGRLELRIFPDGPIYEHPINQGMHIADAFLHNVAVINSSERVLTVERISFSVMAGDRTLNRRIIDSDEIDAGAERFHRNARFGVFDRLPELFGHDVMFDKGEELSPTAALEPQTALIRIQEYFAYQGSADSLAIEIAYSIGDNAALSKAEKSFDSH